MPEWKSPQKPLLAQVHPRWQHVLLMVRQDVTHAPSTTASGPIKVRPKIQLANSKIILEHALTRKPKKRRRGNISTFTMKQVALRSRSGLMLPCSVGMIMTYVIKHLQRSKMLSLREQMWTSIASAQTDLTLPLVSKHHQLQVVAILMSMRFRLITFAPTISINNNWNTIMQFKFIEMDQPVLRYMYRWNMAIYPDKSKVAKDIPFHTGMVERAMIILTTGISWLDPLLRTSRLCTLTKTEDN